MLLKEKIYKKIKNHVIISEVRGVAQLVEHWSPKPGVVGSSPAAPATAENTGYKHPI